MALTLEQADAKETAQTAEYHAIRKMLLPIRIFRSINIRLGSPASIPKH